MKRFLVLAAVAACLFLPVANLFASDYTLIQLSLVPGIAIPFGKPDAGISIGSIGNISGKVDLLQAAGVFNVAERIHGIQGAGVFNIASKEMNGIQLAGVFNITDDNHAPIQGAGVFNIADGVRGFQVAGVFNIADDVLGVQVGPVFNVADDVTGLQVGLINIADEINGLQVGLINIAGNGVFDLQSTWEPDTKLTHHTLKTGNTSVFGVYSVMLPEEDMFKAADEMVISAGLGTRIGSSRGLALDLSISGSQAVGADPARFFDAWTWKSGLTPADAFAPWPTLDASLSLKMGIFRLIGGVRSDISLDVAPNMPASLARGMRYSDTWFGQSFTAWTRWYVGVGF